MGKGILSKSTLFFQSRRWLAPLLLILITLAVFYPVRRFDFLSLDDGMHTEANPLLNPVTVSHVLSFWTTPYENAYTPLTYSLWALGAVFAKNTPEERVLSKTSINPNGTRFDAGVFHLQNLMGHLGAVLVLYFFILMLFPNSLVAFAGALFFSIHPLQVESVCWITGFRDVLAGFFSFAAVYFYFKYCKLENPDKKYFSFEFLLTKKYAYYFAGFLCFFLGVLSKSSALMAPFMSVLIAYVTLKRKPLFLVLDILPWIVSVIPILRVFFALNNKVALKAVYQPDLVGRFFIALDSMTFYLTKLVLPLSIASDYGRSPQFVLNETPFYLTALIPLALTLTLLILAWKKKLLWPLAMFLVFVVGLAPILGITSFIYQHISTVADRYVYLSMFAPSLLLAWSLSQGWSSPKLYVAVFAMLSFCVAKSALQVPTWYNNKTVYTQTLSVTPRSWISANNLGTFYEGEGNFAKALTLYETAAVNTHNPSIWNNAAAMAFKLKNYTKALTYFEHAIELSRGDAWAHHNYGVLLETLGRRREAQKHFTEALQRDERFRYLKDKKIVREEGQLNSLVSKFN